MTSAANLLLSKIKTDRSLTELVSSNLTNADVEGYTRKEAKTITQDNGIGGLQSVKLGDIQRVVDKALQSQVESQSNKLNMLDTLHSYYDMVSGMFGTKGSQQTFAHQLGSFASSLNTVATNPTYENQSSAIQYAVTLVNTLKSTGDQLLKLRTQVDQDIYDSVQDLNNNIRRVQDCNTRIAQFALDHIDSTGIQDERDLCLHAIGELVKVKTYALPDSTIVLATENAGGAGGRLLTSHSDMYLYDYSTSAYMTPNQPLSPICYDSPSGAPGTGIDVTSEFTNGKIGALIELRDQVLTNFQSELDELTRVLRDNINAIHNQGAALGGASTQTGLAILPDVIGAPTGMTGIDGQGTLRIGVTDNQGTLIDYKDIVLSDGMTVNGLITSITNQNYGFSGNGTATGNGGFSVQQLATGELQFATTTPGLTISLGTVTGLPPALISATTMTSNGFDATRALGFSHFFGLNNFFLTDKQIYSSNAQKGLANVLQVNPTLIANTRNLAIGTLDAGVPPSQNVKMGIKAGDVGIAQNLSDTLSKTTHSFLAAGQQPPTSTSMNDYATRLLSLIQTNMNNTQKEFDAQKLIYTQIAERAHKQSAVDPSKELLTLFSLSTSQQISSKALSMIQKMDQDIFSLISR